MLTRLMKDLDLLHPLEISGWLFPSPPHVAMNSIKIARDQIYSFILCNSFTHSPDAVLDNLVEYQRLHGHECMPNIIISLNDGFIQGMQSNKMSLQFSLLTSDSFSFVPASDRCFAYLVNQLRQYVREARTVPLQALDRYMTSLNGELPSCRARLFEIRQPIV